MGNVDSIPVLSQLKSLVQVISGDAAGAKRTQENFRDTAPVVSQITSLVHAASGNYKAARNVQKKFVKGVETMVDGMPVVGHIKGAVHYAIGDNKRGDEIMKDASRPLLTIPAGVAGFVAGGPAGGAAAAISAGHAYDGIVSGIDTAVNGEVNGSPRYYGTWDTYDRMAKGKATSGEIFGSFAGTALDGLSGAAGGKIGSGVKGFAKTVGKEISNTIPGSRTFLSKIKRIHRHKKIRHHQKKVDLEHSKRSKFDMDTVHKKRCRRDVDYHLTAEESTFVKDHLALEGGVGNLISAKWSNMSTPDTVSNLLSLFVILKLILWNDKNGRNFGKELCSYTSHSETEIDNCQFELLVNLRLLENQMQYDTDENINHFMMNPDIPSAMGKSSRVMIEVIMQLFGILSSIGDHRKIGLLWAEELCLFEQPRQYLTCEKELVEKLHNTSKKVHQLSAVRIRRSPTCNFDNYNQEPYKRQNKELHSDSVGPYKKIKSRKYRREHGFETNFEANHIPARSAFAGLDNFKDGDLMAHHIPKDIHQTAMTHVGTSKNSHVAKALRKHERELIERGNLADALELDFFGSYGRANTKYAEFSRNTNRPFRPALVEYGKDLHAVVNGYVSNDGARLGRTKISSRDAARLHRRIEDAKKFYKNNNDMSAWYEYTEGVIDEILSRNKLIPSVHDKVPNEKRFYG